MYGLAMPYYHVADGFTGKTHVWHSTGFCFVFFKALCKVVWCEATGMLRFGGTCIQFLLTNRDLRRHTSSHLSATLYGFLFWMLKKKRWRNHVLLDGAMGHRCVILAKFTVLDHSRRRFIPLIDLDSWTYTPMFQKKGVKTIGFDCSLLQ